MQGITTIKRSIVVAIDSSVGGKQMQRNNGHGDLGQPIPISVIEVLDAALDMRVKDKKAEIIHDGSKAFWPFNKEIQTTSDKYKKAYLVNVKDGYKVRISLVFDYRENPSTHIRNNVGYVRVSEKGRELLVENKILNI